MSQNGKISDTNKRGIGDIYQASTPFNANHQQIQKNLQAINTCFLAKITAVSSSGVNGSKTVSATPLTCQIDANGNSLASPNLVELPHYRVQAGIGALILDPVVGDIGVFVCTKRDISNIKNGTSDPQVPASFRSFDLADSIMIATIHTGTPTTYIHIQQDGTIEIKAPTSITVNTPEATINADSVFNVNTQTANVNASSYNLTSDGVNINAPTTTISGQLVVNGGMAISGGGGSSISGDLSLNGSLTATNDVTASGISLTGHVHGGVQAGGAKTSTPE